MVQSLSINDQKTLTASFSLLDGLLLHFADYCRNWKKEKITNLMKKVFHVAKNHNLVTVQSSGLGSLEKMLLVFPESTIRSFNDNHRMLSTQWFLI
jgi:uncharacterized hydantoinase/oxoprolinase family protein